MSDIQKITSSHLTRVAVALSAPVQRRPSRAQSRKSTDRQYALVHKAGELGWPTDRVVVIDEILGLTGSGAVSAIRLRAADRRGRSWARRSRVGSGGVQIGPK